MLLTGEAPVWWEIARAGGRLAAYAARAMWDLLLTPYDPREFERLMTLSRSKGAARVLRERLHLRVQLADRDPDMVAFLNEAADLRAYLQVAFTEIATRGPSVYLGRGATREDYGRAVMRRFGEAGAALRDELVALGEVDPVLTRVPLDTTGRVFLAGAEQVARVAERIRALDPSLESEDPEAVAELLGEGPADLKAIRGEPFYDWALLPLLRVILWTAEEALGVAISFDAMPTLKAQERFVGSRSELRLEEPRRLALLDRDVAEAAERIPKVGGCLPILLLVVTVIGGSVLLAYVLYRMKSGEQERDLERRDRHEYVSPPHTVPRP